MKNLKLLFIPLVIISLFSFVKAACVYDVWIDAYSCNVWDSCTQTNCYCNATIPGVIWSWVTCGTPCAYDIGLDANVCNPTEYCPVWAIGWSCLCSPGSISIWAICTPTIWSCTLNWKQLFNGQSWTFFPVATVPYTGSCGVWLLLTCNVVGWIWTFTPAAGAYIYSWCIAATPPTGTCTLPRWGNINSWSSTTAYQASSVACGWTCTSQVRTCSNGILSWSYTYGSCTVNGCGGWGWGWGWLPTCTSGQLVCTNSVRTAITGWLCQWGNLWTACTVWWTGNLPVGSIVGSTYSDELNEAYLWAYAYGITTMNTIRKADMWGTLIRAHMAKMISNFAITLGGFTPDSIKQCTFDDVANQSAEMRFYIRISCQLGLMGINMTSFDPNGEVTRAQFGTILSRLIRGTIYNGGIPYYTSHLNALKLADIMTQISNPSMKELRWYVMLMMKRTYEGWFIGN